MSDVEVFDTIEMSSTEVYLIVSMTRQEYKATSNLKWTEKLVVTHYTS